MSKLLTQCTQLLLTDFGIITMLFFFRSPYESVETLTKVILGRLKTQEVNEEEVRISYWRFIDGILVKLHQDGELKKAWEVAGTAAKLYQKSERLDEKKKLIVKEKYLKYLVNCILFAISDPKNYSFLSIVVILANKSYLDKENYKRLLAMFEIELKQKTEEKQKQKEEHEADKKSEHSELILEKGKPDEGLEGHEALELEEVKPKEDDQMVDEKQEKQKEVKNEYIERFRQHMCRLTGLKYYKDEVKRGSTAKKGTRSSVRRGRSARKDESDKENEEEEKEERIEEEGKREEEEDKGKEKKEDESVMEIKMDKKELEDEEKKKVRGKKKQIKPVQDKKKEEPKKTNGKKRKNREYVEAPQEVQEVEDVKDMVKGKQKTKKVKRTGK